MNPDFVEFPKIARYSREAAIEVISKFEKLKNKKTDNNNGNVETQKETTAS